MAAEPLIEEVALNLEEMASATRAIDSKAVGFFLGGVVFGVGLGFVLGYRFNREKIKAEAFKESEEEVAKIREVYRQRDIVRKAQEPKPSVESLIEEKGYSDAPPTVPSSQNRPVFPPRPTRPVVPVVEPELPITAYTPNNSPREDGESKDKNLGWSYPYELSQRSPERPYILHEDEYTQNDSEFSQTQLTYYDGDDVLADEHEMIIENRDDFVGEDNLHRFGHGAGDVNIIFVRNTRLELEFEICRTTASFTEDVLGLDTNDESD